MNQSLKTFLDLVWAWVGIDSLLLVLLSMYKTSCVIQVLQHQNDSVYHVQVWFDTELTEECNRH